MSMDQYCVNRPRQFAYMGARLIVGWLAGCVVRLLYERSKPYNWGDPNYDGSGWDRLFNKFLDIQIWGFRPLCRWTEEATEVHTRYVCTIGKLPWVRDYATGWHTDTYETCNHVSELYGQGI